MAQDNEMIFSLPIEKAEELLLGLKHLVKYGWGMPRIVPVYPEYKVRRVARRLGKCWDVYVNRCFSIHVAEFTRRKIHFFSLLPRPAVNT